MRNLIQGMGYMTGYQLFKQAVLRVFNNFDDALAISGLIWIATMAVVVLLTGSGASPEGAGDSALGVSSDQALRLVLANTVVLLTGMWVAVEWHRFTLLAERPSGLVPKLQIDLVLSYLGKSVVIGVAVIGAMIPAVIVLATLGALAGGAIPVVVPFLTVVVTVFAYYIFLRLSVILPSAALGNKITLKDAWSASAPLKMTLLQVAILSVLFTGVLQLISLPFAGGLIGTLVSLVVGWVMLTVNASLLSSIYDLTQREHSHG